MFSPANNQEKILGFFSVNLISCMSWIDRPTSLAWEVKKMSPGRHVIPSPSTDRISVASNARRSLNFGWDELKKTY